MLNKFPPATDFSGMRFLILAIFALLTVLLLTNCSTAGVGLRQSGSGGEGGADAAFEAQKVSVDFVSAWSRYERGDRVGAKRYLDSSAKKMREQGVNSQSVTNLAARLHRGDKISESDFDQAFATSHREMAGHYRGEVDSRLASNQGQSAGAAMQARAYHLEQSAQWSGQPLSSQEQAEVSNLQQVGNGLQAGSGYLVKGSGYLVQGTGWVLGKGFGLISQGGERADGGAGSFLRGTGNGGETGSRWIENAGGGITRFGDWILGQ
jgi:hypothetical protein